MRGEWKWDVSVTLRNGAARTSSGSADTRGQANLKAQSWIENSAGDDEIALTRVSVWRAAMNEE